MNISGIPFCEKRCLSTSININFEECICAKVDKDEVVIELFIWIVTYLQCFAKAEVEHGLNHIDSHQKSQPYQYSLNQQMNGFQPIFKKEETSDTFTLDFDEQSNVITKGPYSPIYQPLTSSPSTSSPSPTVISTQLKQVSSGSMNYAPMTNFNSPTPVIMQYVPTNSPGTGIQYLQLIPTRPLIVPISPYMTHTAGQLANQAAFPSASSSIIPSTPPTLAPAPPPSSSLPLPPAIKKPFLGLSMMPPGLPTSVQVPFNTPPQPSYTPRSFVNVNFPPPRGTFSSNLSVLPPNYRFLVPASGLESSDMNLNTNEYMPKSGGVRK